MSVNNYTITNNALLIVSVLQDLLVTKKSSNPDITKGVVAARFATPFCFCPYLMSMLLPWAAQRKIRGDKIGAAVCRTGTYDGVSERQILT